MSKTSNFIELFNKTVDVSKNDYTIKELNAIIKEVYNETYKVKKVVKSKLDSNGVEKPKKPLSQYNIFMKEKMAELKINNPDMNPKEKFKIISEEWSKKKAN